MKEPMKLRTPKGYIKGQFPVLPFLLFIFALISISEFSTIATVLLSGTVKAQLSAKTEEIAKSFYLEEAEVDIPKDVLLLIDSCENFLKNYSEEIKIGDIPLPEHRKNLIFDKCKYMESFICMGKEIRENLVIYCAYSLKKPSSQINLKTEKPVILKIEEGDEENEVKIEVK